MSSRHKFQPIRYRNTLSCRIFLMSRFTSFEIGQIKARSYHELGPTASAAIVKKEDGWEISSTYYVVSDVLQVVLSSGWVRDCSARRRIPRQERQGRASEARRGDGSLASCSVADSRHTVATQSPHSRRTVATIKNGDFLNF